MTLTPMLRTILIISAVVAIAVGGSILVAPAAFYAGYDITLGDGPNLVNELQGGGGLLLGSGLLIAAGAFVPRLSFTATLLSTVLYLGYATGRALSLAVHGMPSTAIVLSGVVELVLGLAGVFALSRANSLSHVTKRQSP